MTTTALPRGWMRCALANLGAWKGGGTPSKANAKFWSNGSIPWVSPKDMKSPCIGDAEDHITEEAVRESATNLVGPGSVLVVTRSGILQHSLPVAVTTRRVALNQDLKALEPHAFILPSFLAFALQRFEQDILHGCSKQGTTVQSIETEKLLRFEVPVPPLAEQHRIVDALDAQFRRLDEAVATLERVRVGLARYRAAVLQAAIEGTINTTPSPRGILPPGWRVHTLDELSDPERPATYGVIKLGEETPGGVPTLRTSNVRHLRLDVEGVKRIDPSVSQEYRRTILQGGEILVAVRGTLGGVVVAPESCAGWNVSREVAVVALRRRHLATLVALFLGSPRIQSWLNARARGIAYTGINIATLKETPIPVPPDDQQERLVQVAEQALSIGAVADAQVAAVEARIARLRLSILRLAFEGRLVPQDPNDEPASVLLDRIRASRATTPPTRKRAAPRSPR